MTSGGYRTVSSRATVARFRKHVSPLTGVVTRLERIEADLPMNTNFYAAHNFSAPAQNVDQLRAGLTGGSFGKGSTAEQAEASALMEAIERYSGIFQGDEIRMTRRFTDFAPGDAILPNDVLLFSDAQYPGRPAPRPRRYAAGARLRSIRRPRSSGRRSGRCATDASNIFRPACCISSTAALPPSTPIPTAARPATRSRKPSSRDSSNWWNGMPTRSGGTTGRSGPSRPQPVRRLLRPRSAEPACRDRTQALGARRHQRSRRSDLCGDLALDAERTGKYRVRLRRAFRSRALPCCVR